MSARGRAANAGNQKQIRTVTVRRPDNIISRFSRIYRIFLDLRVFLPARTTTTRFRILQRLLRRHGCESDGVRTSRFSAVGVSRRSGIVLFVDENLS